MLKSLLALSLLLPALAGSARADEFEDRARRAQENVYAEQEARRTASFYEGNVRRMNAYNRFIAQHGGLADSGSCVVNVRKNCRRSGYNGLPWCDYREERQSYTGFDPARADALLKCRFALNDGLACELDLTGEISDTSGRRTARCYDANGGYSEEQFAYGGGGKAPGRAKAPKRRKR